jgi:hypothetical protein
LGDDAFSGAWRVRETVFSPSGQRLGEVAQRRTIEPAGDGRLRVWQKCEPDAALRDEGHPMADFGGEHVFTLSRHGALRRYHGPAVVGGALTIGDGAMIGRGVWPRFGWAFTSWSVLVAPDRQITGGRFHRGGAPMATIVGVAAPESVRAPALAASSPDSISRDDGGPRLGQVRWPGECARSWKGTLRRVDAAGRVIADEPVWRRYASATEWSASDVALAFTERGDALALDGTANGRPVCGFARRFGWMVQSEAVIGDDTIVESIEVFDEARGHLVVLQRWLVDQTLQSAEVLRLQPEADA